MSEPHQHVKKLVPFWLPMAVTETGSNWGVEAVVQLHR